MSEMNVHVHSRATLIKSAVFASVLALLVYLVIILPAEFNQDPTGIGAMLGLNILSAPAAENEVAITQDTGTQFQSNEVEVIVPAGRGVEYKFQLSQYENLTYEWATNSGLLYFDFHGEPAGDTTGYFESYTIATANEMKGSMTVPFDGVHGWYWKNNSDKPITVYLKTQGNYEVLGLKQ